MKKILILVAMMALVLGCKKGNNSTSSEDNGKTAILMVHFGTTHDDTRALTIDAINAKVKETFKEYDVFEAYTSRIIIKKLKERGIEKQTPQQVLDKLYSDGYKKVIIQPTNIISGKENQALRAEAERAGIMFSDIRIGKPLLFSIEDALAVTGVLAERHKTDSPEHHVLFVGHGTDDPATALYSQADYMFKATGHKNFHVATIEGFPSFENAVQALKEGGAETVTLVPFMFVAGDHAVNDISEDWKKNLEEAGFKVGLCIEGLGQVPEIQDIFIQHIKYAMDNPEEDFLQKKNDYLK